MSFENHPAAVAFLSLVALARHVIREQLAVRRREIVWIAGWSHRRALVGALVDAAEEQGASAEATLTDEAELLDRLRRAPLRELRRPDLKALRLARSAEVCLELGGPRDGGPFEELPPGRMAAYLHAEDLIEEVWRQGRGRGAYLQLGLETAPRAARYGLPLRAWRRQLIQGVAALPEELEELGSALRSELNGSPEAVLTSGDGAVLRLGLEPGSARLDSGRLDDATVAGGQRYSYLPAGVVSARVRPAGTSGRLSLEGPFVLGGAQASGIELEVQRGRVTMGRVRRGTPAARASIARLEARKERLSILHVGLNPHLRPLGYFGDRAAHGSLAVTFGDDRSFGGSHASPVALDLCLAHSSLEVGGNQVVRSGRLVSRRSG